MASSEDDMVNTPGGLEDDLFGSDDDAPAEQTRALSDAELDSGDDEGRRDRAPREEVEEDYVDDRVARVLETTFSRHILPQPFDGEFNTLRVPKFLGIEPRPYDPKAFKVPTTDHHSQEKSKNFSASLTAASTIRFRKSPTTGQLESNTNIYKWSDGSMTINVGGEHYEIQSKPLMPPKDKPYQPLLDSHTYLGSPSYETQMFLLVGHMSNQFSVRPSKGIVDEALEKLQNSLAAATRRGKGDEKGGPEIISNTVDPELQKKQAEAAEKERIKAQRRRETAAEKANVPRGYMGRMTANDLEGGSGRRAPASKPRAKPKRKADYDSEDSAPRGARGNDEYDREDDFLASSDEEEEPDQEDEEEDEEDYRRQHKSKRPKISKPDSDEDAEGEDDDEEVVAPAASEPVGRGRKRNVLDDDDDDE